ncbi:MAG: tetratricopeptide repeat protein [bacterium]
MNFIQLFPNDNRVPEVKLKIAESYRNIGQYDNAIKQYEEIIQKYPEEYSIQEAALGIAPVFYSTKN